MEDLITVSKDSFGRTKSGQDVERYIFRNENDVTVSIITYGGIITSLSVPDREGRVDDITLGFDELEGYENRNVPYFGSIVGRVANRIHKGEFELDGKTYKLALNHGTNHIHGGVVGFNKVVWDATLNDSVLKLVHMSPDGDEGYPGELTTVLTYELTNSNELVIDYTATTTKATPVMLTSHGYFNLAGQDSKNVYDHMVTIPGEQFLPVDQEILPTGEIANVDGTLQDLRKPVRIGDRICGANNGNVLDYVYCLGGTSTGKMKLAARVEHPGNGRYMECHTTEPALQFYNSTHLTGEVGKGGVSYCKHAAFCLETQHYNDSVHHPNFPSIILRPGETYRHTTSYIFGFNP